MSSIRNFRFDAMTFMARSIPRLKKIPLLPILIDEQVKLVTFLFKPSVFYVMSQVTHEVKSWKQISTHYHHFGGLQFNVGNKEIGHLHGNGLLDLKIPKKLKTAINQLEGIEDHHFLKKGNWISIQIQSDSTPKNMIKALRLIYSHYSTL